MPFKDKEEARKYCKKWHKENDHRYVENRKKYMKTPENRNKFNLWRNKRNLEIKIEVLTYYGNGILKCMLCGFNDIRALCLDHVNNDGSSHRKELLKIYKKPIGSAIYAYLKRNNYPQGFQTLCMNCNCIKQYECYRRKELI